MKPKKIISFLITIILIIFFTSITVYSMSLKKELSNCVTKLNNTNNNLTENNQENKQHTYDCTFTMTYRVVDMLEGYIAEVPEYSYIVVDQFQSHGAIAHYIPTELKNNLEINHNYEINYHIKGTGIINNIYDVINTISSKHTNNDNLSTTITIKETDKKGLEQTNENICNFN